MSIACLSSALGVFSTLYLNLHRSSFQELVVQSIPSNAEKLFFSYKTFSKIEWIKAGKEFELNRKLYDVSKIERAEKGFHVYCVNDSFEEGFIAMVDQWKKDNSPSGKTKTIFQPQFCNRLAFELTENKRTNLSKFFFYKEFYNPPAATAPSPPPEFHS